MIGVATLQLMSMIFSGMLEHTFNPILVLSDHKITGGKIWQKGENTENTVKYSFTYYCYRSLK